MTHSIGPGKGRDVRKDRLYSSIKMPQSYRSMSSTALPKMTLIGNPPSVPARGDRNSKPRQENGQATKLNDMHKNRWGPGTSLLYRNEAIIYPSIIITRRLEEAKALTVAAILVSTGGGG